MRSIFSDLQIFNSHIKFKVIVNFTVIKLYFPRRRKFKPLNRNINKCAKCCTELVQSWQFKVDSGSIRMTVVKLNALVKLTYF